MFEQITFLNRLLAAALCLVCLAGILWFSWPTSTPPLPPALESTPIAAKPPSSIKAPELEKISQSLLALAESPLKPSLPDLRQELFYYGKNDRPDAQEAKATYYVGLAASNQPMALGPQQKTYLTRKPNRKFEFSAEETPLWVEILPSEQGCRAQVTMLSPEGEVLKDPPELSQFDIIPKDTGGVSNLEIGKFRMDTSLFGRQRGRWIGQDLFLDAHGGEEFAHAAGRQRIEFGETENTTYSCFVKEGDCLVWKDNRWKELMPNDSAKGLFLLQVKKVEDRIMQFCLWDPDGKNKIQLPLIKPSEPPLPPQIVEEFKFIGTRSWKQWIFELRGQRVMVKPRDWWLQTDKGWRKLVTPQEVDDYVRRASPGPLFIVEGVAKKNQDLVLVGELFNNSRTHCERIEYVLHAIPRPPPLAHNNAAKPGQVLNPGLNPGENREEPPDGRYRKEEEFYKKELEMNKESLKRSTNMSRGRVKT